MTEQEAFQWWKTEQDEAGYKQSEIAALAWAAACKWEREACAKVCDTTWNGDADTYEYTMACNECAEVIRMRSNAIGPEGMK